MTQPGVENASRVLPGTEAFTLSVVIGIVGGGISGLALSHYLSRGGTPHTLFESEGVPGGVMRTVVVDGVPLDLGPQRMRLTAPVREVVSALDLEDELLPARPGLPLWVYRAGRLRRVPFTWREALATDLIGWRGKLRVLMEPLMGGAREDESVAGFFERKFGSEAYKAFLGPLYGGLYASDPSRMKTGHGLAQTLKDFGVEGSLLVAAARRGARAREAVPTVTFRGGLGTLPGALAASAAGAVRLCARVHALERAGRGGWLVHAAGAGGQETLAADHVVLALPAPEAARLLGPVARAASERLSRLRYNALAVVHLDSACDLTGYGYQVAFGEKLETRGVTWNASMFGRNGVYTAYLGGMSNPTLVEWDDERIAAVAAREFTTVTGCACRPLHVSRTTIPAWDESWDALSGLELPLGVHVCANWSARPGIPGRLAQAKTLAALLARAA